MPINAPRRPIVIIDRSLSELTYAFLTGRVWADDPRRRITIITFNYDLVIETALTALGIDWNYGTIDANDEKRPSHERCVKLLKLHGSINWARPAGSDNPRSQIPDTRLLKDYETYRDLLGARYRPFDCSADLAEKLRRRIGLRVGRRGESPHRCDSDRYPRFLNSSL